MVMVAVGGVTDGYGMRSGNHDTDLAALRGVCRGELETASQGP